MTAPPTHDLDVEGFAELAEVVESQIRRVIVGQADVVHTVLACLLVQGHVLLEGVPGLGKTVLLRTLAEALSLDFTRVQCTPDLMPADIVGTTLLNESGGFQAGPVFTQLLLADEVNRATPKTQSALLEAMAEGCVTVGGVTRRLPEPFFVMATQNPIEMEGTYPLPEAQLDRFLAKLLVPLPDAEDLMEILARTTGVDRVEVSSVADTDAIVAAGRLIREVPVATHVTRHVVDLVRATHAGSEAAPEHVRRYVTHGASPRGAQSIMLLSKALALLEGRLQVAVEDVRKAAVPCLRHRVVLGYEAAAAGVAADAVIAAVLDEVAEPKPPVKGAM